MSPAHPPTQPAARRRRGGERGREECSDPNILDTPSLSDAERAAILGETAARLLGITS